MFTAVWKRVTRAWDRSQSTAFEYQGYASKTPTRKRMRDRDDEAREEEEAAQLAPTKFVAGEAEGAGKGSGPRAVRFRGERPLPSISSQERGGGARVGVLPPRRDSPARGAAGLVGPWEQPLQEPNRGRRLPFGNVTPQVTPVKAQAFSSNHSSELEGLPPPYRESTAGIGMPQASTFYLNSDGASRQPTANEVVEEDGALGERIEEEDEGEAARPHLREDEEELPASKEEQLRLQKRQTMMLQMEEDEKAVREVYREVFQDTVRQLAEEEAQTQLAFSWGTVFAVIRNSVKSIAVSLCPKSVGLLKALKTGVAYHLPVELDKSDLETLASLKEGNAEDVVIKGPQGDLTKRHLLSCQPRQWLSDPIINTYFHYIEKRSKGQVLFLNSFFYTKLKASTYEATCRWTRKLDLFTPQRVLVAINDSSHWTLAVINNKKQRFEYYDSLGGSGKRILERLVDYMTNEYRKKKPSSVKEDPKYSEWELYCPGPTVPQQDNGYDCGVFCTQFGLYCASELPFSFEQQDMKYLRSLIQLELVGGNLLSRL